MNKEEFTAKYRDELCGFVLAAMVQDKSEMAKAGRFMLNQMRQAAELLDRMFADAESRTLEQVKSDAKALSEDDRALFRAWIDAQPKKVTK